MIYSTLLIVIGLATLFTLITFYREELFYKLVGSTTSIFLWFFAAGGSGTIGWPYEFLYENTADNSFQVIQGVHYVSGVDTLISWVFFALAIIMFIYLFGIIFSEGVLESGR